MTIAQIIGVSILVTVVMTVASVFYYVRYVDIAVYELQHRPLYTELSIDISRTYWKERRLVGRKRYWVRVPSGKKVSERFGARLDRLCAMKDLERRNRHQEAEEAHEQQELQKIQREVADLDVRIKEAVDQEKAAAQHSESEAEPTKTVKDHLDEPLV